jgi:hypothetical protein
MVELEAFYLTIGMLLFIALLLIIGLGIRLVKVIRWYRRMKRMKPTVRVHKIPAQICQDKVPVRDE